MRLPYLRTAAPEVLATAKAQRWDPGSGLGVAGAASHGQEEAGAGEGGEETAASSSIQSEKHYQTMSRLASTAGQDRPAGGCRAAYPWWSVGVETLLSPVSGGRRLVAHEKGGGPTCEYLSDA